MNYQVTCICGQQFTVPDTQLAHHVTCPACHRALIPVTAQATPPAAGSAATPATVPATAMPAAATPSAGPTAVAGHTAVSAQPVKTCPFCGETILAVARKCRFCNEYLDRAAAPPVLGAPGHAGGAAAAVASAPEPVFTVYVSQWDNFFRFTICAAIVVLSFLILFEIPNVSSHFKPWNTNAFLAVLGITALSALFIFLGTRSARCVVRPNRIETTTGIFSKRTDQLDLFRIIDMELRQNLIQRMLGIGTIIIKSNDEEAPQLELYQITQARAVHKYLQDQIPKAERARGVLRVEP